MSDYEEDRERSYDREEDRRMEAALEARQIARATAQGGTGERVVLTRDGRVVGVEGPDGRVQAAIARRVEGLTPFCRCAVGECRTHPTPHNWACSPWCEGDHAPVGEEPRA